MIVMEEDEDGQVLVVEGLRRRAELGIPIYQCPEGNAINFPATWYTPFEAPAFPICSHCFALHISRTIFRKRFGDRIEAPDPDRRCLFNTPRVRRLWSQSLASDDGWLALTTYMRARAQIPNCRGLVGAGNHDNDYDIDNDDDDDGDDDDDDGEDEDGVRLEEGSTRWYKMRGDEVDSFLVCAACYEDVVCASRFKDYFCVYHRTRRDDDYHHHNYHHTRTCDLAIPFIKRAIEKIDTWTAFVSSAKTRLKKPPCCRSSSVEVGSRTWFTTRPLIAGLLICGTCYDDMIAFTWLEGQFERYFFRAEHASHHSSCSMTSLPLRVSLMDRSRGWSCRNIWWHTAQKVLKSPPCSPEENSSWAWFTPAGCGASGFRICLQCYTGMIDSLGHASAFVNYQPALDTVPPKPGERRLCGFNPAAPRFRDYIQHYEEAVFTHDWAKFKDYIWRFARLPVCPGLEIVHDRFWYGSEDFLICESCFEDIAERGEVAIRLPYQRQQIAEAFCDLATPRMRRLWQEACDKHDLSGFAAFAKYRAAIYLELVSLYNSYNNNNAKQNNGSATNSVPDDLSKRMVELERKWKEME